MEGTVVKNCYENKSYTFEEAEICEKFHFDNDYKLNAIKTFWRDHIPKHLNAYQSCADQATSLEDATILEKEQVFADCHNAWVRDFKDNKVYEMELRARDLLGKNLE